MFRLLTILPFPVLCALSACVAFGARVCGWRRGYVRPASTAACPIDPTPSASRWRKAFYRYLGELSAEVVSADRIPQADLEARVVLDNPEVVQSMLDGGKRVMILAAHHCNWEWLLLRCSTAFGEPLVAAYKPASRERRRPRTRDDARRASARRWCRPSRSSKHLIERRGKVKLAGAARGPVPGRVQRAAERGCRSSGSETAFYRGPGWIAAQDGLQP